VIVGILVGFTNCAMENDEPSPPKAYVPAELIGNWYAEQNNRPVPDTAPVLIFTSTTMTAATVTMEVNVKDNTIYFQDYVQYTYKIKSIAEYEAEFANMRQTGDEILMYKADIALQNARAGKYHCTFTNPIYGSMTIIRWD
jgi:hypothetical protein